MSKMEEQERISLHNEIKTRFGTVNRTAGYHLYTSKGVRLLDLYQEGGTAILGWRAGRAKLEIKNILDRGLTGTYPTVIEARLVRSVQAHLPDYSAVRWYATLEKARMACAAHLDLWADIPLIESPFLHPEASIDVGPPGDSPLSAARTLTGVTRWRPWLDEAWYSVQDRIDPSFLKAARTAVDAMVLCTPFPWAAGCHLAVFSEKPSPSVPPSDPIPPVLLAGCARAFDDLGKALAARGESDWAVHDAAYQTWWERRGPYLVPKMRRSKYPDFFRRCLDGGILISPDYDIPSIVPWRADAGELKALRS